MNEGVEVWKAIPGFARRYQASSLGHIRRINAPPNTPWKEAMVLKLSEKVGGYLGTTLTNDKGCAVNVYAHILVASAFFGVCPRGHEVNHKDFDTKNNRPANLEYLTPLQQAAHRLAAGRYRHSEETKRRISESLRSRLP